MAFQILSNKELELLTENQRESYERELAIYSERVKFVEQMERLENTVITPYELELAAIPVICEIPQEEFVEPEYVLAPIAPIVKPELDVPVFDFGGPVTAVRPEHVKITNIPAGCMKKLERDKPILPIVFKAAAPANSFTKVEQQRPTLPECVKISIPDNTFHISERTSPNLPLAVKSQNMEELCYTPITIDSSAITVNNPQLTMPVMEVPDFTAPEYAVSILPKPEVEIPKIGVMDSPEVEAPVLPNVIVLKQMDVSFRKTGEIKAELPETFDMPNIRVSFGKPDIQQTKLPTVLKAEIPTKEFTAAEHTASELPMVSIPKSGVAVFTAPELPKPTVQKAVKPAVSPRLLFAVPELPKPTVQTVEKPTVSPDLLFAVPELPKPTVQKVVKPSAMPKPFHGKLSADNTPKIEYPSIAVISVKPFEIIHSKAGSLPAIPTVDSPGDCAEELLQIRSSLQKEYETGREGFA